MSPTRSEFLRSEFYLCALSYNKRNEERLKNIHELLEKAHRKTRNDKRSSNNRYRSNWQCPEDDHRAPNIDHHSKENLAILSANKDACDWAHDVSGGCVTLIVDEMAVMKIPEDIFQRLKPFQRDAVRWVAFVGPIGGILADDMGMGKTFMSICSIGARMMVQKVKMVLIVAPTSVLGCWADEAKTYLPKFLNTVRVDIVHGQNPKDRIKIIRNAWKNASDDRPRVVISSWGLVCNPRTVKNYNAPSGHFWDYVIMDEAHVIKNHTSTRYKCCRKICHKKGTKRLLLTGTPFQNDTTELWSLMNMATWGKVLGKLKEFNKEYGKPIQNARCRNASRYALEQGNTANESLQERLKPYVLRRRKVDFLATELPLKHEICVWVKPSQQQEKLYRETVLDKASLAQKILCADKRVAQQAKMCAFQVLKNLEKICSHPLRLLKNGAGAGVDGGDNGYGGIFAALAKLTLSTILGGSKKLELTVHMLQAFRADNHKTLVFSQSTQNLDILQYVLLKLGTFQVCRLDGSVSAKKRQDMVASFQHKDSPWDVFLISTGAGGVGLTLTRASRVILWDPSWNPSQDAQAVDRAYRIGQTQEVHVYRLLVANSLEEKMYEKQIHKAGMEKTIFTKHQEECVTVASGGNNTLTQERRFFDKHELCRVFSQIPSCNGTTCELLDRFEKEGVGQFKVTTTTSASTKDKDHRPYLNIVLRHSSVMGVSNHSNVYHLKRKSVFADAKNSSGEIDHAKKMKLNPTLSSSPLGTSTSAAEVESAMVVSDSFVE